MSTKVKAQEKDLLPKTFRDSTYALKYIEMSTRKLDKNGVLICKIPYSNEFFYYPIHMARYSLGNLEKYLDTKNIKNKAAFFCQVNWLFQNLVIKDGFGVWEHHYSLPYYDFNKIPWVHGLGQGLGLIVLLKAYQLTENNEYLVASKKVYRSFEVEIVDGGVRFVDDDGNVWFEEYAILPPPHVLNGFITILFSIHEFYRVTKIETALGLWNDGIQTLKRNLNQFDIGYWSLYDLLFKYPSAKEYHAMHSWQLNLLYELTGEKIFCEYAKLWKKYTNIWIYRSQASLKRGLMHLKRYGPRGSMKRYLKQRKWKKR